MEKNLAVLGEEMVELLAEMVLKTEGQLGLSGRAKEALWARWSVLLPRSAASGS